MEDPESISGLFAECLNSFGSLIIALSNERCRVVHLEQIRPVQMFEEYGRFKIWGDQTKAELPSSARGSLDDTLRRDAELKDLVQGILKRLRAVLSRATDISSRTVNPAAGSDHDSISSVSAESESDSEDDGGAQSRRMPQIRLLVQQITGQIRALYDLSSLLRRPNVTDKYIRSVQTKIRQTGPLSEQVLDFSSADLCHVEEKVLQWRGLTKSSQASSFDQELVAPVEGRPGQHGVEDLTWFCLRLAGANTRRREQLGYWAEHPYERDFSKPIIVVEAPVIETRTEESRSQVSTLKPPVQSVGGGSSKPKTDTSKLSFSTAAVSDVVDGGSITRPRTVYAPSVVDHGQSNTISPPPKAEEGQATFSCPYCGMSLDSAEMQDRQSWKRHVFRDLRPYVCTFEGCQTAGKLYVSRHEWVYHEMQTHRREYACRECDKVFPDRAEMTEHIHSHHEEPVKPSQLNVMLDLCSRQVDTLDPRKEPCLICGQELSLLELQSHLATHMESLAIFVLPSAAEDDGSKTSGVSVRMANVESTGVRDDAISGGSSLGFSAGGEPHHTAAEFERLLLDTGVATVSFEDSMVQTLPDPNDYDATEVEVTISSNQDEEIVDNDFGYVTSEDLVRLDAQDSLHTLPLNRVPEDVNKPPPEQDEQDEQEDSSQEDPALEEPAQEEPLADSPSSSPEDADALLAQVTSLIEQGAIINPYVEDEHGRTPLHLASLGRDERIVKLLLISGANPKTQDRLGNLPLHYASKKGLDQIVSLLLQYNPGSNVPNDFGSTTLHLAASFGSPEVVRLLLSHSAFVNAQDHAGSTPLHIAVEERNAEVVWVLLENHADANLQDNEGRTPLHLASSFIVHRTVEMLLLNSANPNVQDHAGATPLHYAAHRKNLTATDYLHQHGANLEAADENGITALHVAALGGDTPYVDFLLAHGAEVDRRDNDGRTALHKACWAGHDDMVDKLLEFDANVDARDGDMRTPLHRASRRGHVLVVRKLLQKGADVRKFDRDGWRALHEAADAGHAEVVNLLCLFGANVSNVTHLGRSPLHMAAWNGHTDVIRALLGKGANINLSDNWGWTPLMWAASRGFFGATITLLQMDALPGKRNRDGDTAWTLAQKTGNEALTNLLRDYSTGIPMCSVPECGKPGVENKDRPGLNTCAEHINDGNFVDVKVGTSDLANARKEKAPDTRIEDDNESMGDYEPSNPGDPVPFGYLDTDPDPFADFDVDAAISEGFEEQLRLDAKSGDLGVRRRLSHNQLIGKRTHSERSNSDVEEDQTHAGDNPRKGKSPEKKIEDAHEDTPSWTELVKPNESNQIDDLEGFSRPKRNTKPEVDLFLTKEGKVVHLIRGQSVPVKYRLGNEVIFPEGSDPLASDGEGKAREQAPGRIDQTENSKEEQLANVPETIEPRGVPNPRYPGLSQHVIDGLEDSLTQLLAKITANPDSYVMTENEYFMFDFFYHDGRFVGNEVAERARKRYLDREAEEKEAAAAAASSSRASNDVPVVDDDHDDNALPSVSAPPPPQQGSRSVHGGEKERGGPINWIREEKPNPDPRDRPGQRK